ncbi:hypothetical protein D9615_006906 [Tricholomella constricta]|uniref:Uncharacterized protein n=1 Tax=Tricholomella constricta TaxID=117010 RepID=A0A8H5M359_9AGAR|nr:hypothetical protein D9615_006906 [Tricholomella constricta]
MARGRRGQGRRRGRGKGAGDHSKLSGPVLTSAEPAQENSPPILAQPGDSSTISQATAPTAVNEPAQVTRTLRPNRNPHPAAPDLPAARRPSSVVTAEREKKILEKAQKQHGHATSIRDAAAIEDAMEKEDEAFERDIQTIDLPPRITRKRPVVDTVAGVDDSERLLDDLSSEDDYQPYPAQEGLDELFDDSAEEEEHQQHGAAKQKEKRTPKERGQLRSEIQALRAESQKGEHNKNKRKAHVQQDKNSKKLKKSEIGLRDGWDEPVDDIDDTSTWDEPGWTHYSSHKRSLSRNSAMSISSGPAPTSVPASEDGGTSDNEPLGGISDDEEEESRTVANVKSLAKVVPTTDVSNFIPPEQFIPRPIRRHQEIRTLKDIPAAIKDDFDDIFCPKLHEIFGIGTPWGSIYDYEPQIHNLWAQIFPTVAFGSGRDGMKRIVMKLADDRLGAWRTKIGKAALDHMSEDLELPEDTPEYISKWCKWALSGTYQAHPFYWREYVDASPNGSQHRVRRGMFQHPLILVGLGHHLNRISSLPANQRSKQYPETALIMAIQAASTSRNLALDIGRVPRSPASVRRLFWRKLE